MRKNGSCSMAFTLGIDYGTNSVRAIVVDCSNGVEIGSCVVDYPTGEHGILLDPRDPNLARQHPGEYHFGLENSVRDALEQASGVSGFSAGKVIGIGVDTGSSPLPVDEHNVPPWGARKMEKQSCRAVLVMEGPHQLFRGGAQTEKRTCNLPWFMSDGR